MNTPQQYQLIDGTFTPDQARQILGAMVKSKIDFHTLEKHSEAERSGPTAITSARLETLRNLDAVLKSLFEKARATGATLKVRGNIEITLMD